MYPKPLLLIILDGFGVSSEKNGNPAAEAKTPTLNEIERNFPFTTLQASGAAVGLPWGEAGNSEVGHLTIGSGRVIYHHLPRIINSIYDGSFFENTAFLQAIKQVKEQNSSLHLAGLISSGSVHSYIDHLYALLNLAKQQKVERVFIHAFTDGKDAPPKEGSKFLQILEGRMELEWPQAHYASVIGRFYAMDRDEKWNRVRMTYELLTEGKGEKIKSIPEYLHLSYNKEITDEFIEPALLTTNNQFPVIKDNDSLVFFNFREDSMRELTRSFIEDSFDFFPRKKIQNLFLATMTEYQKGLQDIQVAFPPIEINQPLSLVLSQAGLRHLHIAETEKYAHVTYFFNGGTEKPFPRESRILIPSIPTAHFDEVPQMRASEITAKILENFDRYDVIIANFANADMVGHSGNFKAATQAVETLDETLGQILNSILNSEGVMLITGDHGNIELKRDAISGEKLTEHSMNPVPFYLVGKNFKIKKPRTEEKIIKQKSEVGGILTDVAPTVLELLGLKKPKEMTGKSLLDQLINLI